VVAGPSEITREARKLYAAPQTPGHFQNLDDTQLDQGPMEAIELSEQSHEQEEAFEIVNVADESAAPLERLAEQLGVPVPDSMARRAREAEAAGHNSAGGGAGYGELEIDGGADSADDGATLLEARPMVVAPPAQPPPPPPSSRPNLAAAGPREKAPSAARTTQPGAPPFQPRSPSSPALQAQGARPPPPPTAPPPVRPPNPPSQARVPAAGGPVAAPTRPPPPPAARAPAAAPSKPVPASVSLSSPLSASPPAVSAAKSTVVQRGVRVAQMGAGDGAGQTGPQRAVTPDARPAPPAAPPAPQQGALEAVFAVPAVHGPAQGTLSAEDVATLEALRTSMEKGALVLRAIAELCVDKGVFTREEMKNRAK
jgi:hypothetical protein